MAQPDKARYLFCGRPFLSFEDRSPGHQEIRDVIEYAHKVMRIPAWRLLLDGVKWLGPPILMLVGLYVILHLK